MSPVVSSDASVPASSAAAPSPEPLSSRCYERSHDVSFETLRLRTDDDVDLYAALAGEGDVGVVLANDVPHPICEEVPPAVALAKRGYRVIVFDYRDRGGSGASEDRGRLDLDVSAAADEVRSEGSSRIVLMGSYAGAAAALVAATEIQPTVAAVVGFSPTAVRGEYVEGPFDPVGQLEAAADVHAPAMFVTSAQDAFVPVREARRVYAATASARKRFVLIDDVFAGWYLLEGRVLSDVDAFIQRNA
jgi:dienelactone hydrolase